MCTSSFSGFDLVLFGRLVVEREASVFSLVPVRARWNTVAVQHNAHLRDQKSGKGCVEERCAAERVEDWGK